jgi:hypothetical protein
MFLLNGNRLSEGRSFTDANGNQYPANWLNFSTEEEKNAIGITWVDDPVSIDLRFYWDANLPKDLNVLKPQFISQIKELAGTILAQSDWYVIRKIERNAEIPLAISEKRNAIIVEEDRLEVAINASATVEELIEVLNTQNWGE